MFQDKLVLLLAVLRGISAMEDLFHGEGATGLYWDCCKPSCSWRGKGPFTGLPVTTCDKDDAPIFEGYSAGSACGEGGTAYVCNNQQPWAVNDTFAYGFVSAFIPGGDETDWCCSCYDIEFLNGNVKGKRMIVQASNTGYDDPSRVIFGMGAPGEKDYAGACLNRYDGVGAGFLGKDGQRVQSVDDCESLPEPLQAGCRWRFDWWDNAMDPNMTFTRIKCPKVLTDITGCIRSDEDTFNGGGANTTTSGGSRIAPLRSDSFGAISISTVLLLVVLSWVGI